MNPPPLPPLLIFIAGPTAVGKTEVAVKVAKHFGTEVISADSRQFYREMPIGTATPTPEEMDGVQHHFIGNLSIHDYYNVSMYEKEVMDRLKPLFAEHGQVVMTGGSGMYFDVVEKGIDELPDIAPELRKELAWMYMEKGMEWLQFEVQKADPEFYATVDKMNPARLLRALEVHRTTGKKFSVLRKARRCTRAFRVVKVGLQREKGELFGRINQRVDDMMGKGWLEECRKLYDHRHLTALKTVGYKEIFEYLDGTVNYDEALENIRTMTRRYAKRQITWFSRDKQIRWFHPDNPGGIISYIESRNDRK